MTPGAARYATARPRARPTRGGAAAYQRVAHRQRGLLNDSSRYDEDDDDAGIEESDANARLAIAAATLRDTLEPYVPYYATPEFGSPPATTAAPVHVQTLAVARTRATTDVERGVGPAVRGHGGSDGPQTRCAVVSMPANRAPGVSDGMREIPRHGGDRSFGHCEWASVGELNARMSTPSR